MKRLRILVKKKPPEYEGFFLEAQVRRFVS